MTRLRPSPAAARPSLPPVAPRLPGATLTLCVSAVLFGLTPLFARGLQAQGVGDAAIAFYRFGFSALALLPFVPRARAQRAQALALLGGGALMGLGWIGWLEAVRQASVAAAGVVYMTFPLFAALFAWALAGLRPGRRGLGAGALVLGAAALAAGPAAGHGAGAALLWALPAPASFGLLIVLLTALTPKLGPLEKLACSLGGSALGLLAAMLADGAPALPAEPEGWAMVAGLGLVTALAPQIAYVLAAPRVGPSRAAATGAFELPTMMAIGALAFGEAVAARELAAGALVIAAIFVSPALAPEVSGASRR